MPSRVALIASVNWVSVNPCHLDEGLSLADIDEEVEGDLVSFGHLGSGGFAPYPTKSRSYSEEFIK